MEAYISITTQRGLKIPAKVLEKLNLKGQLAKLALHFDEETQKITLEPAPSIDDFAGVLSKYTKKRFSTNTTLQKAIAKAKEKEYAKI